ncbi:NAD(P)H-binding protein [Herbiconiux moechotypicola]|uniref:SDR family oxidoreductase n=1 Tax=Herbiconiux moechotypicola TaxID=637393 RepID=A0ABN3DNC9_9MICO|nr:NAD(P)H-binding protein [Herbiconiux moechotypicola]MCS5730381.1 NAD(P)H-binding protein [Herbiconiux moechotypicola]
MTIAVTGATGHLGRLAIDHLLARGVPADGIVAVGRSAEKLAVVAEQTGVRTAVADFGDPSSLDAAFAGADSVVFVSGSEVGRREAQHANVIAAVQRSGAARVVYTSAPSATDTALILAPDHAFTERALAESGVPAIVLRNGWYHENYAGSFAQASASGVYTASTGEGRVSSAARSDYAEAIAAVLTSEGHEGAVYELSGDTAWDGAGFAAAASEALGREIVFSSVTPEEHLALLTAAGLDEGTAGFVVALDGNIRDGLLGHTPGTLSKLIGHPTQPLVDYFRTLASNES